MGDNCFFLLFFKLSLFVCLSLGSKGLDLIGAASFNWGFDFVLVASLAVRRRLDFFGVGTGSVFLKILKIEGRWRVVVVVDANVRGGFLGGITDRSSLFRRLDLRSREACGYSPRCFFRTGKV